MRKIPIKGQIVYLIPSYAFQQMAEISQYNWNHLF